MDTSWIGLCLIVPLLLPRSSRLPDAVSQCPAINHGETLLLTTACCAAPLLLLSLPGGGLYSAEHIHYTRQGKIGRHMDEKRQRRQHL